MDYFSFIIQTLSIPLVIVFFTIIAIVCYLHFAKQFTYDKTCTFLKNNAQKIALFIVVYYVVLIIVFLNKKFFYDVFSIIAVCLLLLFVFKGGDNPPNNGSGNIDRKDIDF